MRKVIFCLFFIYSNCCLSQCNKINIIDSLEQKIGFWIEYDSLDVEGYNTLGQTISDSLSNYVIETITKYERIIHSGNYINGKKNGLWTVSKPDNKNWINVYYSKGEIIGPINIYYSNGSLLYSAIKINNDIFEVKEFDESGLIVKRKNLSKVLINSLSEKKLFVIGYDSVQ